MNIVVFGGSSSIAIAISKKLAKSNLKVFHVSRSGNLPGEVEHNCSKISSLKMDLADENQSLKIWKDLISRIEIHSIVFAQRYHGDTENFLKMYQCDVVTPFKLVEELCRFNKDVERRIIFFTSPGGRLVLQSQNFQYHATKSAISIMNKYFASGVIENLISNAICPSSFVYKSRAEDFYKKNVDYFKRVSSAIPSRRYTQIDDIAIMAEFLLIRAPNTINGLEITLDGGLSALDHSNIINRFNPLDKKP